MPKEVEPILIALLLGLLTDYSVFFLAGVRRRLAEGRGRFAAAQETTRENLPIVLTAGLIVALGSLTLVVGQLDVFRSFGPGMALTVLVVARGGADVRARPARATRAGGVLAVPVGAGRAAATCARGSGVC